MVVGGVTLLVALLGSITPPGGAKWFQRLQRPSWLTFEKLIPVIWTVVFVCGAVSATLVWQQAPGEPATWLLMAGYVLLELITVAYSPVMLITRKLRVGMVIGATGFVVAIVLALSVLPVSGQAAAFLLPYLIWSPIGTYTTWVMAQLNPSEA